MKLKLHTQNDRCYPAPDMRIIGCRIEDGYGTSSSKDGDITDPAFENENDDFWGN